MNSRSKQKQILGLVSLAALVAVLALFYMDSPRTNVPVEVAAPGVFAGEGAEFESEEEAEVFELLGEVGAQAGREVLTGPERAEYVVLGVAELPLVGATFLLSEPGLVLQRGETDALGRFVNEECDEGMANLLILAANAAPQVVSVPRGPGRFVIQLERGAVVSGRVRVDGKDPGEPLRLILGANSPQFSIEESLGLSWSEAGLGSQVTTTIETVTDEDGSFLFWGLRWDWSGDLKVPPRYQLKDHLLATDPWWRALGIERPTEDLLVELTKPLRIVGRVVEVEGGGKPVAGVRVDPTLLYADGSRSRPILDVARADEAGRFELLLVSAQLRGTSLRVYPPSGLVERAIPIEAADLTGDLDLGDIALRVEQGKLALKILVQDREGTPIQGAVASVLDAFKRKGAPTDEEGRTVLTGFAEGFAMIRTIAVGYEIEDVPVAVSPDGDELVVTLRRGTLLRLRFLAPDGTPTRSTSCAITTDEYPFEQDISHTSMFQLFNMEASLQRGIQRGAGVTLMFSPSVSDSPERPVVVSAIKPGLAMHLLLVSRYNNILGEYELAPLLPEEHRDVDITLDHAPRTLRVRVLDEAGAPLSKASVGMRYSSLDLSSPGGGGLSLSGSEEGEFEFQELFAETVELDVACDGYIPFHDSAFAVPADGAMNEIRLIKGRDVLVTIEDEAGRPLLASVVARLPNGGFSVGQGIKTGQCLLQGMPDTPVTVTALMKSGGSAFQVHHKKELGAHELELHFVFPVAGRVEGQVTLPDGLELEDRLVVWLISDNEEFGNLAYRIDTSADEPVDFVFEEVVAERYVAKVQWLDTSRATGEVSEWQSEGIPIEVEPNRTTTIEL